VFGCIMVQDGKSALAYHDLSPTRFEELCDLAHELGYVLVSASVHGTAGDPRFAVVFEENPGKVRWGRSRNDTAAEYQDKLDAFVGEVWARPSIVTTSDSMRYLSVFRDDEVGSWVARHDMTKAGYEAQRVALAASGYRPMQIMVAGQGAGTRYAALFQKGTPAPYLRTTTGSSVPALAGIDELMLGKQGQSGWEPGFMQDKNARAAAVAIAKDGRLVFARGYTYAKSGYPVTQPTTRFRLASCSKPLTAMAIFHLDEKRSDVARTSKLVDLVPLGTPQDGRVDDITVTHLLDHRSGYSAWWGDGCTDKLAAARDSVANGMLAADPGAVEDYSNAGYMMLGLAIEQKSGRAYFDYLQQNLFTPLGITRARLIATAHRSGDAHCQEAWWGGSRVLGAWASPVLAGNPIVNGAYAISDKAIDASGGLDMSVVDYVRVLAGVFDRNVKPSVLSPATRDALEDAIEVPGRTGGWDGAYQITRNGRTYWYYEKGGLWRSAHALVARRSDGVSIAAFCSGPNAPPMSAINALIDGVASWPQNDLFPAYGLPTFLMGQEGSYRAYGASCAGSNGVPRHDALGLPEIGRSPYYHLGNGPRSSVAVLALGASDQWWGALPLPFSLTAFGAPGCRVYAPHAITLGTATYSDGSAVVTAGMPDDASLIGARLFTQFVNVDPTANALGLTFTNGLETVLGGWR
jgi:CubicO group peptidase (beta-lactamase class C family)